MRLLKAENIANKLMDQHGLIKNGWKFTWLKHSTAAGLCNYTQKEISLSLEITMLNIDLEVIDTIVHEIAHALTPGTNHGSKWKAKCVEIGCRPEQFYTDNQKVRTETRYSATCETCGHEYKVAQKTLFCYCSKNGIKKRTFLIWTDRKI